MMLVVFRHEHTYLYQLNLFSIIRYNNFQGQKFYQKQNSLSSKPRTLMEEIAMVSDFDTKPLCFAKGTAISHILLKAMKPLSVFLSDNGKAFSMVRIGNRWI